MSHDERPQARIAGLPVDEAVEVVVDRTDVDDRETVRQALAHVETDGVVSWSGFDDALAHLSKVVSTPETRAELAAIELADAREAAEPVADLDAVRTRLAAFERRLDDVETQVEDVAAALQSLVDDEPDGLYKAAAEVQRVTAAANDAHHAADKLQVDLEQFQRWLGDAETRREAFAEELDELAGSIEHLAGIVDELTALMDDAGPDTDTDTDVGVAWFDVLLRLRALEPLFSDLRRELTTLEAWDADTGGDTTDDLAALEDRLDDLHDRWQLATNRLEELARPAWRDRFDERLSSFDAELDQIEPPVDWGAISAALDEARAGLDDTRAGLDDTRAGLDDTRAGLDDTRAGLDDTR